MKDLEGKEPRYKESSTNWIEREVESYAPGNAAHELPEYQTRGDYDG